MRIKFIVKDKSNQPIKNARVEIKYRLADTILLAMDPLKRFNNVEGDLTVDYDASKGNLQGRGGAVESFSRKFIPTDLVTKTNPHAAETIVLTSYVDIGFIRIAYTSAYEEEKITATANATVILTYAGIINP